jgi:hypothetical protein
MVAVTVIWDFILLDRTPSWLPAIRWTLLVLGLLTAIGLAVGAHLLRNLVVVTAAATLLAGIGGSAAYAVDTASGPHTGATPSSGPAASAGITGGFGRGAGGGFPGGGFPSGSRPGGGFPGGEIPGGALSGGETPSGASGGGFGGGTGDGGGGGGGAVSTSTALVAALKASPQTWAAATVGANSADGLELASGTSVMAIGGFTGSDPSPTLSQFQQWVAAGKVHYFIGGQSSGGFGGGSGSGVASQITDWVTAHFTKVTIGGQTLYDLTKPLS